MKIPERCADLDQLNPMFRGVVEDFLERMDNKGLPFAVYETYRSPERQAELYLRGRRFDGKRWVRDPDSKEKIVTNAGPYQSPHNYGLAVDIVLDIYGVGKWQVRGYGRAWNQLGALGKKLGLFWGKDFKSLDDYPHFELPRWRSHRERGWWAKRQNMLDEVSRA